MYSGPSNNRRKCFGIDFHEIPSEKNSNLKFTKAVIRGSLDTYYQNAWDDFNTLCSGLGFKAFIPSLF